MRLVCVVQLEILAVHSALTQTLRFGFTAFKPYSTLTYHITVPVKHGPYCTSQLLTPNPNPKPTPNPNPNPNPNPKP